MKSKIFKYSIWALLVGWLLFSAYYIGRDYAGRLKNDWVTSSYQKGVTDSVNSLITESKKCQPVTAYNKDEKIEMVATSCLNEGWTLKKVVETPSNNSGGATQPK